MDKKKIIIVTGTGGILGTGHIQRMLNLAVHLNRTGNYSVSFFLRQNEYPLSLKFNYLIVDSIPSEVSFIIHDMRDSSPDEMKFLKNIAPVITIDDYGLGGDSADYTINLLPLPLENSRNNKPDTSLFLYGYNFTEGVKLLSKKNIFKRNIDVTIYAGYDPSPELVDSIRESIPDHISSVILKKGMVFPFTGNFSQREISYTEILFRTKIIVTHFGLTMFEADACGCTIAALNPTKYHTRLTESVSDDFKIIYSSEYDIFLPYDLKKIIIHELMNFTDKKISPTGVLKKISAKTENFLDFLNKIINTIN